jgi:hypothetical protein
MECVDQSVAIEEIEDALTDMGSPYRRGVVNGLCGGFYMSGLINKEEWEAYLKRIPDESLCCDVAEPAEIPDPAQFKEFLKAADRMIEMADKEQMAECARLLALNVAHYEMRFGELPLEAILATTDTDHPNAQQAELLARSMMTMAGILGNVMQGFEANVMH